MSRIARLTLAPLLLVTSAATAQNTCQEFAFQNVGVTRGCAEGFGTFQFAEEPNQTFIKFNGELGEINAAFDSTVDIPLGLPPGLVEPILAEVELIQIGASNHARAVMHRHTGRVEMAPAGVEGLTDANALGGSIGGLTFTPVLPDGVAGTVTFDIEMRQTYRTQSLPADVAVGQTIVFGGYGIIDESTFEPVTQFGGASFNTGAGAPTFSPGFAEGATVTTEACGEGCFDVTVSHKSTFQGDTGQRYLLDSGHSLTIGLEGINSTGGLPTWLADSQATQEVSLRPRDPRATLFLDGVTDPVSPQPDQLVAMGTDRKLYRIDTATRQATLIGPGSGQTLGNIKGFAFGNDGTLYAIENADGGNNSPEGRLLEIDLVTGEETSLGFIGRIIGNAVGLANDPATDTLLTNVDRSPNSTTQDPLVKVFRTAAGQAANGGQVTETIGDLGVDGNSVVGLEFDGDGVLFGIDGFNNLQTGVLQEELVQIDHLDPSNVAVIGDSGLEPFPDIGDLTIGPSGAFWAVNEDDQSRPELVQIDPETGLGTSLGNITGFGGNISFDAYAAIPIDVLLTGDFNRDGVVDASDYTVWRDTLGSTSDLRADGNLDGVVDERDHAVWRLSFGMLVGASPLAQASTAVAVPEPGPLALVALTTTFSLAMQARRSRPGC